MGWLHWIWFWFRKRWVASDTTKIIHQQYKLFHLKFQKEHTYSFDHDLETWDRVTLRFPSTFASSLQLDGRGWPRSNKVDTELSFKLLCEFPDDGLSPVTRDNWQGFSRNARTIKKRIIKKTSFLLLYIGSYYQTQMKRLRLEKRTMRRWQIQIRTQVPQSLN
jgi:hypothetical protein